MKLDDLLEKILSKNLKAIGPNLHHTQLIKSAVLIPIIQWKHAVPGKLPEILLTVRDHNLTHHAGQVCFPGGRFDQAFDSSLEETALRESHEETGIEPSLIHIKTHFGYLDTITGYRIFPFIGLIDGESIKFQFNSKEVTDHFFVPLTNILNLETYRTETREFNGLKFPTYSFVFEGHKVWGATARILHAFAKAMKDR